MKKTIEANKIRKMQSELHMIDEANNVKNTHILFTDSGDEDTEIDLAKRLNTHPSLLHRRTNRPRLEDLNNINIKDDEVEVGVNVPFHLSVNLSNEKFPSIFTAIFLFYVFAKHEIIVVISHVYISFRLHANCIKSEKNHTMS